MEDKVNYTHAINFRNPFHSQWDQGNSKNKTENAEKWGCNFLQCIFILSQNVNHTLILDHL